MLGWMDVAAVAAVLIVGDVVTRVRFPSNASGEIRARAGRRLFRKRSRGRKKTRKKTKGRMKTKEKKTKGRKMKGRVKTRWWRKWRRELREMEEMN